MTTELDAELESLDCEYGLSAENGDETELDVSVDPSSNTSGNEDQEANLDKSIEDENEIQAIDIFYGSACCSLGPKKAACWTQFHRKSVIIVTPKGLDAQRQWYLYEQIRPFCHSNLAKDITCPKPTVSKPCGGEKPTGVTLSTLSRKRKQGESSAASQPAPKRKQKLPKSK